MLFGALLTVGLQACAAPTDGVTGTPNGGTTATPQRFESSVGVLSLNAIGATQSITVTARDRSGTAIPGVAVSWTSSDLTVADVTGNGSTAVVTARGPGRATIRARSGDAVLEIGVGVLGVRSITITPQAVSVITGGQLQLNAVVAADAGALLDLRWISDNPSIASVNSQGTITGVAPGTAVLRINAVGDPRVTTTAQVTVTSAGSIAIAPSTLSMAAGEQRTLSAVVNLEPGLSTALTWRSQNNAVATVSSTGVITGVSVGSTLITATSVADTTRRGTAAVTIVPVVRDLEVTPAVATLFSGDTRQLAVSFTADPGASQAVIWRSSNAAVASVSAAGLVSGVSAGSAIITAIAAADTTKRATSLFTVRFSASVSVSPAAATIGVGETRPLVAAVTSENGASTAVTWRSGNASIATVSADGLVTGVAIGTTEITAVSVADTARRATSTITVAALVRSVSVSPRTSSLLAGQTVQLVPTVVADAPLSTAVSYRTTNAAVASVSATGQVTAVAGGSAGIVVASVADTMRRDTAFVTVANSMASTWTATRLNGALYDDVVSLRGINSTSAFAVNVTGDVFRWSGGSWSLAARGASYGTQFQAVHASSSSHAIAVGTNGVILRFDGAVWSVVSSGTTQRLSSVFVESASSAFAVGESGTALRWDGSDWSSSSTGSSSALNGVWASGGNAFAVGDNGEVYRYGNGAWSRQSVPTTESLLGISGAGGNVFAVGAFGTVLAYSGGVWTSVGSESIVSDFYDVSVLSPSDSRAYIASDDGLLLLANGALTPVSTPYAPRMFSLSTDATGALWAGGQRGSVQRLADASWETLSLAPDLIDAWSTSATNTWAVGEFGFIYRWDGTTWARQATPTTSTLNAVWGASATEAFAAGNDGVMLRYDGTRWTTMSFPSAGSVYGLWGTSGSNVFAVTSAGEVVRFNGTFWSVMVSTNNALLAIHGTSPTAIVATGENGAAMRFNGSVWSAITVSTTGTLAGVWSSGAGATAIGAAASGTGGIAFSYSGTSWTSFSTGSNGALTSIWGPAAWDLYATGEQGTLLHFNGAAWSAMATGTTDLLWSVTGAPNGNGAAFAVGYNSTVVAGSNGASFTTAAVRALRVAKGIDLDPSAGARKVRGPLPSGKARKSRGKR